MGIYSSITGRSMEEIEREFDGKGYGDFKPTVAEAVIAVSYTHLTLPTNREV